MIRSFVRWVCVVMLLAMAMPSWAVTQLMKQGATDRILILEVDTATGQTGQTGLAASIVIKVSKNGAPGASSAGSITEMDSTNFPGVYYYTPTTAETNTLGTLSLHITCTGCQVQDYTVQIVAFDPASATNLGLSALPTANPATANGLPTIGTGANQIQPNGSGGVPTNAVTTITTGTAQSATSTTLVLATGTGTTYAANDQLKGDYVLITSGTGVAQSRTITGWTASSNTITITRAWTVTPDNTSVYYVIGNPHPAVDANLAVTTGTNNDKTNMSLTAAEHTAISGNDVPAGLTAQGYTTTRAAKLDNADTTVSSRQSGSAAVILPSQPSWAFFGSMPSNWLGNTPPSWYGTTDPFATVRTGTSYGMTSWGAWFNNQLANVVPTPAQIQTYLDANSTQLLRLVSALAPIAGAVNDTSATTTSFVTNLSSSMDLVTGAKIVITSGPMAGLTRDIAVYTPSTQRVKLVQPTPSALGNGVTFSIVPGTRGL